MTVHNILELHFRDAGEAFDEAIASGFLNTDKNSERYAGKWMYMHTDINGDAFKNINSRNYIYTEDPLRIRSS